MVRATYWKINTVYVAFIILYFITIEEVCCVSDCEESKKFTGSQKYDSFRNISNCEESRKFNGLQKSASSRNTSFVKRLGKSFKGLTSGNSDVENVNEICLSDIKNDLKNCKDAKSCAEKMFYTVKDFEGLQLYTKTYVLYLYREIAIKYKDYLITPNEYCKIVFEDDSDRNKIKDEIEMYKKCIHKNKAYGFWHKYAHRTVVQAFFLSKNEQDGVKLDENFLDIVKSVKTRFITDTEVMNWKGKRGPTEFCSAKCIDQISYAFNDCKSFKECAIFAYRYLIKKELKFFALQYMKYLYENIEIGKYSIKYDLNDLTKKGKISTIEESIVMTPKSFCIVIADELWSTIVIDIVQWSTRAKACFDDMVESGIDLDQIHDIYRSIESELQKLKTTKEDERFKEEKYKFLREGQESIEESNKGYFERVFFHISLTNIDTTSDAYDYVEQLMTFADFDENNVEKSHPKQFCERLEANIDKPLSSILPDEKPDKI